VDGYNQGIKDREYNAKLPAGAYIPSISSGRDLMEWLWPLWVGVRIGRDHIDAPM